MATFVHTADVHLDTPFSANFSQKQMQLRRREVLKTFQKVLDAAKGKDFLFISGDLFDGRFVSLETVSFVKRCLRELGDTKVFIAAGNHDPLNPGSVYQGEDWGENVHIFSTQWEYFDFPELKTRIHGRSFGQEHEEDTLLTDLPVREDWCNMMVLHGDVVADGGKSAYNPMEKGKVAASGMDYLALGHIHQASGLVRLDNTRYAYPGVPEGRGFDEEGVKGFYQGVAEKGNVQLTWVPASRRSSWHLQVDVTDMEDSFQVQDAIVSAMEKAGSVEDIYKIYLIGQMGPCDLSIEVFKEELKDKAFYLDIIDETRPEISLTEMAKENTLRGDFVSAMLREIEVMLEEEKEIGYLALELGIKAMERGQGA